MVTEFTSLNRSRVLGPWAWLRPGLRLEGFAKNSIVGPSKSTSIIVPHSQESYSIIHFQYTSHDIGNYSGAYSMGCGLLGSPGLNKTQF